MSHNIMNEYVSFTTKSFKKYFKLILEKLYDDKTFKSLMEVYIAVRYYDLYANVENSLEKNIDHYLRNKTCELMEGCTEKEENSIKYTFYLFRYMLYFDEVKKCSSIKNIIDAIEGFRMNKLKFILEENPNFRNEMFFMVRENAKAKEEFLSKFKCNDFYLDYNETNINNLFNVFMNYDLRFPKLYSEYAIDRAFNAGIINEHKLFVEYCLVTTKIIETVKIGDFSKEYLLDFAETLFEKKEKINRVLEIINNDFIKEKVNLKLLYKEYKKNKKLVYNLTREGYKIAIVLDETYDDNDVDREKLVIFNYIIVRKEQEFFKSFKNNEKTVVLE